MDIEKSLYILNHFRYSIDELINNVLNDSETDPHFSAVTATNQIKCYIAVMNDIGQNLPYDSVEGYFKNEGYEVEEYVMFEEKRKIESEYYIGKQY